jgi:hypothetical protein
MNRRSGILPWKSYGRYLLQIARLRHVNPSALAFALKTVAGAGAGCARIYGPSVDRWEEQLVRIPDTVV